MSSQFSDASRHPLTHEDGPAVSGRQPTVDRLPPLGNAQTIAGLVLGIVSILPGLLFLGSIWYLGYRVGIENLANSPDRYSGLVGYSEDLFYLLPVVGMDLALGGLVISFLGRRTSSRKGIATAGFVLSLLGLVLGLGLPLWWFSLFLGYHV